MESQRSPDCRRDPARVVQLLSDTTVEGMVPALIALPLRPRPCERPEYSETFYTLRFDLLFPQIDLHSLTLGFSPQMALEITCFFRCRLPGLSSKPSSSLWFSLLCYPGYSFPQPEKR